MNNIFNKFREFIISVIVYVKSVLEKIDVFFDGIAEGFLNITDFRYPRSGERIISGGIKKIREDISSGIEVVGEKLKEIEGPLEKYVNLFLKKSDVRFILKYTWSIFIVVSLLAGAATYYIARNMDIVADYRVYLPQEHETKYNLDEISRHWGTDTIIIYVKVPGENNITSIENLRLLRKIEQDINFNRDGTGRGDGVYYINSINSLIEQVHNSTRFFDASSPEDPLTDQDTVDNIVRNMQQDMLSGLVRDRSGNGLYDAASVSISITPENQTEIYHRINGIIMNETTLDMELTGSVVMAYHITEYTRYQVVQVVPFSILLAIVIIFLLHRDLKAVFIAGIPTLYALIFALAIATMLNNTTIPLLGPFVITPQIVIISPVILGLGVDYGLHITNRFSEEHGDDDKRIRKIFRTTGKALVISAITTMVGFLTLTLSNFIPLIMIGFTLAIGILLALLLTFLLTPGLIVSLKYIKKHQPQSWKKISTIPKDFKYIIISLTIVVTLISISLIPAMETDVNYYMMGPEKSSIMINTKEYSETFEGGNYDLVMIRAKPATQTSVAGSFKDPVILQNTDLLQSRISAIDSVNTLSVVDIMKSAVILQRTVLPAGGIAGLDIPQEITVWWLATNETAKRLFERIPSFLPYSSQEKIIEEFFNSLSPELRYQLVTRDYSRALILITTPVTGVETSGFIINRINGIIDDFQVGDETLRVTGGASVMVSVNQLLISNQTITTFLAILFVGITLTLIFKSVKIGILTMIPMVIVISWQPLVMILSGVPLSVVTVMIGSMVMGMGIDYGIHISERILEETGNSNNIRPENVENALRTSGVSITEAVITTVVGLAAGLIIDIRAIQEFLFIAIVLIILSVLSAMFILPSMYLTISAVKDSRTGSKRAARKKSKQEKAAVDASLNKNLSDSNPPDDASGSSSDDKGVLSNENSSGDDA